MSSTTTSGVTGHNDPKQSPLPSGGHKILHSAISYVGSELSRPECVLAERDGTLIISDSRGAFTQLKPDGTQQLKGSMKELPNGMAIDREGILWIANIGDCKLYKVDMQTGAEEVVLENFSDHKLGSINFVYIDAQDRMWVTVSTRTEPRRRSQTHPVADGYILCIENGTPRLAMDGFFFTNEARTDSDGMMLYVAETMAGRISRCAIGKDGTLGPKEAFGPDPLYEGARVDGICFDEAGNLWVTELSRNALIVIEPSGNAFTAIEDPDGGLISAPSSVTFGGADLRTVYVGSLTMTRLATFRTKIPGVPLRHWDRSSFAQSSFSTKNQSFQ